MNKYFKSPVKKSVFQTGQIFPNKDESFKFIANRVKRNREKFKNVPKFKDKQYKDRDS